MFNLNLNKLTLLILFFFISLCIFRGRLGSDDLETFNTAFYFYQTQDFNIIENTYVWRNRTVWFFLDLLIIFLTDIFFSNKNLELASRFICGYSMTFFAFVSYFLIYRYFKKKLSNDGAYLALTLTIFTTPILILATGDGIESLIFLLFVIIIIQSNKTNALIGYILFLIKFYHAPLIILLEIIKKNYISVLALLILMCSTLIYKYCNLSDNSTFPYNLIVFQDYFTNLFNISFSVGSGFFIVWSIYLIFVLLGYNKETLIKFIGVLILLLFFSIFPFWHGQGPGTRYVIPLMVVFIPEISRGISKVINTKIEIYLRFLIIIISILNLSTLEYRNTSIYEYRNDSAMSGKAYGVNDRIIDFYDFRNYEFNPIIFASKITILKFTNSDCNKSYISTDCEAIYPKTLISRINYSIERSLPYTKNITNPLIIFTLEMIQYLLYVILITFILFNLPYFRKFNVRPSNWFNTRS